MSLAAVAAEVDFLGLLAVVAPVFLMMAAGFAIRRVDWLSAEADASLLRVTVNLLYPCLILDTILGNAALDNPANVTLAPAIGFGTVALSYLLTYAAAPLFGIRKPIVRRTFAFTAGIPNYGYIALPLVQKLFGAKATAVLFLHNVGVEAALWTVGILLLSGHSLRGGWRRIINVPLIAILTALVLNFAGAQLWLPAFVRSTVHSLGGAAIPLGLILTGATFADQIRAGAVEYGRALNVGSIIMRLALLPGLLLAVAATPVLPLELRQVVLVQMAMPAAVVPVILAKHFGGDGATALRVVLITSALGLLTIPLWLRLGLIVLPALR